MRKMILRKEEKFLVCNDNQAMALPTPVALSA